MKPVRLFFEKVDRAKYISHLDITRCLSRAFARSGIPVWYTEGFNPRIYMSFALPLSLGYEGLCEFFDIRLLDDAFPMEKVVEMINPVLPEGIRVLRAAAPVSKPEAITGADYAIRLYCENPQQMAEKFRAFAAMETISVVKKTKKVEKEMDIKPLFQLLSLEPEDDILRLTLRNTAGITLNISPSLVMQAFEQHMGAQADDYRVTRTAIYRADGTLFE